jgi:hypothetical protein
MREAGNVSSGAFPRPIFPGNAPFESSEVEYCESHSQA